MVYININTGMNGDCAENSEKVERRMADGDPFRPRYRTTQRVCRDPNIKTGPVNFGDARRGPMAKIAENTRTIKRTSTPEYPGTATSPEQGDENVVAILSIA
jgi:hypothetical protein